MKDVFIIYDECCFYEIVILNYFMSVTECDVVLCSLENKPIKAMEGYSVNADVTFDELDMKQIRSFIVPGVNIANINNASVRNCLSELKRDHVLVAGICAGVDLLEDAGVLNGIKSTHSTDLDIVNDDKVITARANAYVDFAIEVAKELNLFEDEADLQETIDFWKNFKRAE